MKQTAHHKFHAATSPRGGLYRNRRVLIVLMPTALAGVGDRLGPLQDAGTPSAPARRRLPVEHTTATWTKRIRFGLITPFQSYDRK